MLVCPTDSASVPSFNFFSPFSSSLSTLLERVFPLFFHHLSYWWCQSTLVQSSFYLVFPLFRKKSFLSFSSIFPPPFLLMVLVYPVSIFFLSLFFSSLSSLSERVFPLFFLFFQFICRLISATLRSRSRQVESFSLLAAALNLLSATQTVVELKIQKPSLLENTQDVWSRNNGFSSL